MDISDAISDKTIKAYSEAGFHPSSFLDWSLLPGTTANERYQNLEKLLKMQPFRLKMQADQGSHERFQHWFYSQRNAERLHAERPLGLGYPLLTIRFGEQLISAPLLIWPMQIEPGSEGPTQWNLTYTAEYGCRTNNILIDWLKKYKQTDISADLLDLFSHQDRLALRLPEFCTALSDKLCLDNPGTSLSLMTCPDPQGLYQLAENGAVVWSGLLAWYPEYYSDQVDMAGLAAIAKRKIEEITHPFGALPIDPWQAAAAELYQHKGAVLIDGHSGTGKTQLLLYLLTNALLNNRRCLVVSPSMAALKRIQDQLVGMGLEKWHFLLRDEVSDKAVLLETLKAIAKTDTPSPDANEATFRQSLDKALRSKKKLDERFRALHKPVFGDNTWTETVGLFLAANKREGKEILSNQLNAQDFSFDYEEFKSLKLAIEGCYPLFQRINTLNHPLRNLNAGIFIHQTKQEGLHFIQTRLDHFIAKTQQLQLTGIAGLNEYHDRLSDYCERYYASLMDLVERIKDTIRDNTNKFGDTFLVAAQSGMRFKGIFSAKQREMLDAYQELSGQYEELKRQFATNNFLVDITLSEASTAAQIKATVDKLEEALANWIDNLPNYLLEELQRLNAKTVNPRTELQDKVEKLEFEFDALLDEINESGLYQLPLENKMLTIPKRHKFLEAVIDQMETTRLNLRDFDAFYDWQRHWFRLPEVARRIVKALASVRPPDWVGALESWYLHNCLSRAYETALPISDMDLKPGVAAIKQVRELSMAHIIKKSADARELALKAARRREKGHFELLFGKRNSELSVDLKLKDIFEKGFEDITRIIPIWLTTPRQLQHTLLSGENSGFDVVFVDEAQDFDPGVFSRIPFGAAHIAIFASRQLSGMEGKLPAKLIEAGFPHASLHICHKWAPGDLGALSDNKTEWAEEAIGAFQVVFEQVDGRFDESTGLNEAEAQRILQLLNDIHPTPQRTFPSVGIICMNEQQRDLIARYLLQIKQKRLPGAEKIQQLERNGLGVYAPGELSGLSFDTLILSGTWGLTDLRGSLPASVDELLAEGHWQALMNRAKNKIVILNSIPVSILEQWQYQSQQNHKYLLANYYQYMKALAEADATAQDIIVQRLRTQFSSNLGLPGSSSFSVEVAQSLAAYLEAGRMQLDQHFGHWRFPLIIQNKGTDQRPVLIQPDAYFSSASHTDMVWEYEQRQKLSDNGFDYLPVWSAAWWKAAQQEARKIAGELIKMEN